MTTTPHGQVPEALQLADEISKAGAFPAYPRAPYEAAAAELRRLHAYCQELESQVIRDCMTHDQKPAEIEHVAGDVSKNGAEANMAYAELPEQVGWRDSTYHCDLYYDPPYRDGLAPLFTADQMRAFADATHALRTQLPAPATQQAGEVVAYLDIGAGGYLDLGTDLADEALSRLPKGRHALVIAGTYGIDGYTAASTPQSAPAGVLEDAARWHWMAEYIVGTRTDLDDELIACQTVDELRKLVDADLAARKQGANHD